MIQDLRIIQFEDLQGTNRILENKSVTHETEDLITFTEEIFSGKLQYFCSDIESIELY